MFFAAGLVTSLAPITSETSVRWNSRVDVVHLLELVVGHVGLGQQHVHVPRHAPRDRVDRVADLDARASRAPWSARARRAGPGRPPCRSRARSPRGWRRRAGSRRRRRSSSAPCPRARPRLRRPRPRRRRRSRRRRSPGSSGSSPSAIRLSGSCPRRRRSCRRRSAPCCSARCPWPPRDRPVKAFSSEITTGMSAPPIGSTTALPSSAAQTSRPMKSASECAPAAIVDRRPRPRAISSTRLTICCAEPSADRAAGDDLLELAEGDVRAPEGDRADDRREQREDRDVGRRRARSRRSGGTRPTRSGTPRRRRRR